MEESSEKSFKDEEAQKEAASNTKFIYTDDLHTEIQDKRMKMLSDTENFSEFVLAHGHDIFSVSESIMKNNPGYILSVFEILEHTFLIETTKPQETAEFIAENRALRKTFYQEKPEIIPKEAATINLFCNSVSTVSLKEGALVRANISPLNTVGQVRCFEKGRDYAWIHCIPRIDYDEIERTKITSQRVISKKKGPGYVPPFAPFKKIELNSRNAVIDEKRIVLSKTPLVQASVCKWDGSCYEGELMLVKVPIKNLQLHNIKVNEEEEARILKAFGKVSSRLIKIKAESEESTEIPELIEPVPRNVEYCQIGMLTDPIPKKKFVPKERVGSIIKTKTHGIGILTKKEQGKDNYFAKCSDGYDGAISKDDIEYVKYDVIPSDKGLDKNGKEVLFNDSINYLNHSAKVLFIDNSKALIKLGDEYLWVDLLQCQRIEDHTQPKSLISERICERVANIYYRKPKIITSLGEKIETQDKKYKYKEHGKQWQFYDEIVREGKLKPIEEDDLE